MSDTTVLASSMNKVPLFKHIHYMFFTTVPSICITLVIFLVLGLSHDGTDSNNITAFTTVLSENFTITPWLLIVPLLTGIMIARKMPAIVVLALSTVLAAIAAVVFQPSVIEGIGSSAAVEGTRWKVMFTGIVKTVYDTVSLETGNPEVNQLVTSRGMTGMLNTVYLIICAMCFGASMKASGMLKIIASFIRSFSRSRVGLVTSTVVTGTSLNGIVSDQYLSIILTSSIFKDVYEKEGYEARLLSRAVEDSATVTSPLFPWSSCGMTQSTILGVSTITYLPYCFFNLISPLMSIIIALTGYKVVRAVKR
jgi:NhaC family Na+:H+ antiporter